MYNIDIPITQATITRMIIISQRKLLVNRKENNMGIEKTKKTLNQIDDDNTVEEMYLWNT